MYEIEKKLFDLFNHVKENKDKDFNISEFIDIVIKTNNLKLAGSKLNPITYEIIDSIWELKKNNIYSLEREPYIAEFIIRNIINGELSEHTLSYSIIDILKKIAEIDFNISKEKDKNLNYTYNNEEEYFDLIREYSKIKEEQYPSKIDFLFVNFRGSIDIINPNLNVIANEVIYNKTKKKI